MRHPPGYRDRAPFAAPLLSGWPSLISSSTPSNPTDTTTSLPNCGCAQSRMSTSSSATPPRCFPPWPPDSTPPLRPSSTLTPLGKLPPSQGRDILHHRQLQSRRNPRRRLPGTRRSRLCLRRLRPGKALDNDYLKACWVEGMRAFYPSTPAVEESSSPSGTRSGWVVLTTHPELAAILSQIQLLRPAPLS